MQLGHASASTWWAPLYHWQEENTADVSFYRYFLDLLPVTDGTNVQSTQIILTLISTGFSLCFCLQWPLCAEMCTNPVNSSTRHFRLQWKSSKVLRRDSHQTHYTCSGCRNQSESGTVTKQLVPTGSEGERIGSNSPAFLPCVYLRGLSSR